MLKVLVACEESQRVCIEFRKLGHEAYSADIQKPSGGHPEWHIHGDVLNVLNGGQFLTMDGIKHTIHKWDLIIAHPPCTYLTCTGNRWFNIERYGDKAIKRLKDREEAAKFFMQFANADCDHIVIENPVGYMSTIYRKADQIIQPYMFGHEAEKKTCLWLKNLPTLKPTNIVTPPARIQYSSGKTMPKWYADAWHMSAEERSKFRSKTFEGIAQAMAEQWSKYLEKEHIKRVPVADVQPANQWISVEDKLPIEQGLVLCNARSTTGEGNYRILGALRNGEFWFLQVDGTQLSFPCLYLKVTHWMPLPEPPKDGDANA